MSDAHVVREGPATTGTREAEPVDVQDDAGQEIRTFLIADIRGYTAFTQEHGDEAAALLATGFAEIVRELVSARAGSLIEIRGDEALAVFTSPRRAIRAAVDLQARFLQETTEEPSRPLAVGIGLDAGEAAAVAGGYRGGALNRAARLCGQAAAGEILATQSVVYLAGAIDGISYLDHGPSQLKGLAEPIHVLGVSADDADVVARMSEVAPRRRGPAPSRGRIEFRVLGPLQADGPAGPFALGGPKQRTVLAHLLLRANEVVPTEVLIDHLWEEEPPENARNIIQIHVSRLRKVLGPDRIEGISPGYRLRVDPPELDMTRFESLLRDAAKAMPIDPTVAIETLDEGLALWRGSAFADLAGQPSLRPEATRLDELRLQAQEERIRGSLAAGIASHAIADAEALLARDPWRESVWASLMLGLYRDGRQADALDAFRRAREILATELGVDPSPELERLHERILRHDEDLELRGEALRGYRLLERIGEGSNGIVYRAIQPNVHRDVAVKVFHERVATDPGFVERFEAAAQRAAALEHPHIVPIYDYWREPGSAYVASRYLRGGSLRAFEERGEVLDRDHGLRVFEQLASALAFAHARETPLGHVAASNVLFDVEGNAFLGDFSLGVDPANDAAADVLGFVALVRRSILREPPPEVEAVLAGAELGIDVVTAADLAAAATSALTPSPSVVAKPTDVRNPFKGLRAFSEADALDFFGRGALVGRLRSRLQEGHFLAVVGPSGSGKSSVVRAGLIPSIREGALGNGRATLVAEVFPGAHPIEELEAAMLRIAVRAPGRLDDRLRGSSRGLLDVVDLLAPSESDVLLVVDQLEEVFTLTEDEHEREAFLELIRVATADPGSRVWVIATLRADFYDRPLAYPRFGELLAARTEAIPPLTPDELELAISRPAEGVGLAVEPGLVAEVIADVAPQPGALPSLQYAMTELVEGRDGSTLTRDAYRRIGGVTGALSTRADQLYEAADANGRKTIRQVFLRLVTLGEGREDTRRRVTRSELDRLDVPADEIDPVLAGYGRHRILTFDREPTTREPTVEIAHEALLRGWGRLRSWIDGAREDLRRDRTLALATAEWRGSDRDPSFLMRGTRLDQLEGWAASTDLAIGRDERAYLKASVDQRAREHAADRERKEHEARLERRSRARLRALVAVLTIAALVAGSLTLIATDQRGRAARAAARAEQEALFSSARELAAASVANLDVDPELSILLALESIKRTRSATGTVLRESEEALHRAVTASRVELTEKGLGGKVAWGSGVFVTEGPAGSGVIDIRDVRTGDPAIPAFRGHDGDITDVAFSRDGSILATTGVDGALRLWDPTSGDPIWSMQAGGTAMSPSFDDEGSLVAAAWGDTIRVFEVTTGDIVRKIRRSMHEDPSLNDVELSHDGRHIALLIDSDSMVEVVGIAGGTRSVRLDRPILVHALAWSPDDRSIATVGGNAVVMISDAITGRLQHVLHGQRSFLWAVAWAPVGGRIVTGGDEGAIQVWEIDTNEAREVLSLRSLEMAGRISGVDFSPDGRSVIGGAGDLSAVKIWDVGPNGDAEWANIPAPRAFGDAAFIGDSDHVAISGEPSSVGIWKLDPIREIRRIRSRGELVPFDRPAFHVSPDGGSIAIHSDAEPGTIGVYDTQTGEPLFRTTRKGPAGPAWSHDGSHIALGGGPSLVRILDRSGLEVATLVGGDEERVVSAAFSPDGRYVATSVNDGDGGLVRIWDWARGDVVREFGAEPGELTFDRTGARVALTRGTTIETYDIETQRGSSSVDLGEVVFVGDIALDRDLSRIAASLPDGTIRLLDARSGRELIRLRGHTAGVSHLAFSPDGDRLISVGFGVIGDVVRVWALDVDDLIAIARRNVFRELTDEECRQYLHAAHCSDRSGDG